MATSPKKKNLDLAHDEPTLSRSGRVRKPKVFYDPSDIDTKRRSLPIIETVKTKKVKLMVPEAERNILQKSLDKLKNDSLVKPGVINSRRKTICSSSTIFDGKFEENGCIVCGRSDIKKGRFVSCIVCIKRGHFTCLRNDKLFKTTEEHNWQCPSCKICEFCRKVKPNEQLYKCVICFNSCHLHCSSKISPLPKSVVKKKFKCGSCMKEPTSVKPLDSSKSLIINRKSDGFPGFAHEETSKIETKSLSSIRSKQTVRIPVDDALLENASQTEQKFEGANDLDCEIKREKKSPTSELGASLSDVDERQSDVESDNTNKISVRKDLVEEAKTETNDGQSESENHSDIIYDKNDIFTPHESIPDVRKWDCDEVYIYFMGKTLPEYARLLKDNQIDGDALLLLQREDVVSRFNLKLGQALRLYSYVVELQFKCNNPSLAWAKF